MNHKRRYSISLMSGALVLAASGIPFNASAQSQPPIKIGFLSSFQGPANQSGFNGLVGTKMAVKEINEKGGILGRQVEVVQGDDASDPTQGVTEARRLVQREGIQFMIGPIASQITLAVAPVLNEAKIAWISVSGSTALTPQVAPYHFSILNSADTQAEFIAQYVERSMKAKSAAILHDPGAQNRVIVEGLRKELTAKGIKITGVDSYEPTATDMTPQLLTLRRTNPDVLLALTGGTADSGYILKNLQDINWDIRVAGATAVITLPATTLKIAGPAAYKNVVGVNYVAQTYCSNDPVGQSDFTKFKERLQAYDTVNYPKFAALTVLYLYDAVYAMKAAMEGAKSLDGATIAAWMEQNASKIKVINGVLTASKSSHFLIGTSAMVMSENPDKPRSDGLLKRAGC